MNFSRIKAIFFRYFYMLKKGPQQLSDLFYWPLIDILLWGLTSIWIQKASHEPLIPLFLMTGLIFWQITWRGSIDVTISLLNEFWDRNLTNLFSSPLKISEWCLGVLLFCLGKLCVTVSFGVITVYLLYALNVLQIGWLFLPFALLLLLFGWSVGFMAAGLIVYFGRSIEALAWMIGFVFAPFSAVFYPVSVLPEWAQTIAWCLPTTYIFEGMRLILREGIFPTHYFWISLSLNALYMGGALWLFYFMFEKRRKKGFSHID